MKEKKVIVHSYWSDERVALQREISQHPELCIYINQLQTVEWTEILGVVNSYLGLRIDSDLLPEELDPLYVKWTELLVAIRKESERKAAAVQEETTGMYDALLAELDAKEEEEANVSKQLH